jgi:hypothetical protein
MKDKILAMIFASLSFVLLIWLTLFMVMCEDLNKKITSQNYYIKELEWENDQHVMYCENN